jgi:hypothetical protein
MNTGAADIVVYVELMLCESILRNVKLRAWKHTDNKYGEPDEYKGPQLGRKLSQHCRLVNCKVSQTPTNPRTKYVLTAQQPLVGPASDLVAQQYRFKVYGNVHT